MPRPVVERLIDKFIPDGLSPIIKTILRPLECTLYDNHASGLVLRTMRGVPHGDPLSPLLLSLFMHTFLEWSAHLEFPISCEAVAVADDVTLMRFNTSFLQPSLTFRRCRTPCPG